MTGVPANIHATAIVVGERGLIFVGPSGIGKSMMAFTCLAIARRAGAFAALVADDQVLISREHDRIIATCPATIAGMMELRGSGIIRIDHVQTAALDLAIRVVSLDETERLPPENERLELGDMGSLPMVRIGNTAADPLAVIGALIPGWRKETPFW